MGKERLDLQLNLQDPIIVFDTETGGLNPDDSVEWSLVRSKVKIGDKLTGKFSKYASPILELGAIRLNPFNLEEVDQFHSICGPEKNESFELFISKCTDDALKINGFNSRLDELKNAEPTSEVLKKFISWLPKTKNGRPKFIPSGQNARYDIDMINHACLRHGINFQIYQHPLELISFSLLFFGLKDTQIVANHRLTTVASALGVDTSNAHSALADVRMTAECLRKIFYRFSRP
jgi:DNA polymerase III epsilon subunit-like protein